MLNGNRKQTSTQHLFRFDGNRFVQCGVKQRSTIVNLNVHVNFAHETSMSALALSRIENDKPLLLATQSGPPSG